MDDAKMFEMIPPFVFRTELAEFLWLLEIAIPPPPDCHHAIMVAKYGSDGAGWELKLCVQVNVNGVFQQFFITKEDETKDAGAIIQEMKFELESQKPFQPGVALGQFTSIESRSAAWIESRIGPHSLDPLERSARVWEEACEFAQANQIPFRQAAKQLLHTYERKPGEAMQEARGLAFCLAAWCFVNNVQIKDLLETELTYVESRSVDSVLESLARKRSAGLLLKDKA